VFKKFFLVYLFRCLENFNYNLFDYDSLQFPMIMEHSSNMMIFFIFLLLNLSFVIWKNKRWKTKRKKLLCLRISFDRYDFDLIFSVCSL